MKYILLGALILTLSLSSCANKSEDTKETSTGTIEETSSGVILDINTSKTTSNINTTQGQAIITIDRKVKKIAGLDKPGDMIINDEFTIQKGKYEAHFRLKTDNINTKNVVGDVFIDGLNNMQPGYSIEFYGEHFENANTFTDLKLYFEVLSDDTIIMPWVYYSGESSLWLDGVKIYRSTVDFDEIVKHTDTKIYEEEAMGKKAGEIVDDEDASNKKAIIAKQEIDEANHIVFGPYSNDEKPGNHTAIFRLKLSDNSIEDIVARLEVFNTNGDAVNKNVLIRGTDFKENNIYQDFSLNFTRTSKGTMEYRLYYYGKGDLSFDNVTILGEFDDTEDPQVEVDSESEAIVNKTGGTLQE